MTNPRICPSTLINNMKWPENPNDLEKPSDFVKNWMGFVFYLATTMDQSLAQIRPSLFLFLKYYYLENDNEPELEDASHDYVDDFNDATCEVCL